MAPLKDGNQNVTPTHCSKLVPNTIGILLAKERFLERRCDKRTTRVFRE
jgi:hypothetical protein